MAIAVQLAALAPAFPNALLDAIEQSQTRTHASARAWAIQGLRSIAEPDTAVRAALIARSREWCSVVSRGVRPARDGNANFEHEHSEQFRTRVGVDASGPRHVLGVRLKLVDWDDGMLSSIVPSLLEGLPIVPLLPVFETAAVAMTVGRRHASWTGLKWLVHLNEIDYTEANAALRQLSVSVLAREPEEGINPLLPARAAALLLWLIGTEDDDRKATDIDPGLENSFDYARDYFAKPSQSFFELERRHAHETLTDGSLPLVHRIRRVGDLWFDSAFAAPQSFVAELRAAAIEIDVTKLDQHSGHTAEDHSFEEIQPALARCAPDILVDLLQRKMQGLAACPPKSRYWSGVRATSSFLLAGPLERAGAKALRMSLDQDPESNERFAASQLLLVELHSRTALEQAETLIEAKPDAFLRTFSEVLQALSPDDADALIARHGQESSTIRDLLYVLAHRRVAFSERAFVWLGDAALAQDGELRSIAFRALALSDAERFGQALFNAHWTWSPMMGHWESYYGSGALIEGTRGEPFDRVVHRIAPWRLLEAARRRGADPVEVRLAANVLTDLLRGLGLGDPDPGATLSVDRTDDHTGTFRFSTSPRPTPENTGDPVAAFKRAMDGDAQLQEERMAAKVAVERIAATREAGGLLYLTHIGVEDVEVALTHCPDLVSKWLDGLPDATEDLRLRVHLAEGL